MKVRVEKGEVWMEDRNIGIGEENMKDGEEKIYLRKNDVELIEG